MEWADTGWDELKVGRMVVGQVEGRSGINGWWWDRGLVGWMGGGW